MRTLKAMACNQRENTCTSMYLYTCTHTHTFYYVSLLVLCCDDVILCHRFIALSSLVRGYANVPDADRTAVGEMAL